MSSPQSNTPWVLISGVGFTLLALISWVLLQAPGRGPGGRGGIPEHALPLLDSNPRDAKDSLDMSTRSLTDATPLGGRLDQTQKAEQLLGKAADQALGMADRLERERAEPKIRDFDGKGTIALKPRKVPRGPLAFLTLTTINPASVTVAEGDESLGETPLRDVPVLVGKHTFRLLDNRGNPRRLELEFEHGKTLERLKLDVAALPAW